MKASSEEVTIKMTPLDGAPAFDQTSLKVQAKKGETVKAEFTKTFKEPVNLRYEIREIAGTTDAYIYDDTVYTAIVCTENDENEFDVLNGKLDSRMPLRDLVASLVLISFVCSLLRTIYGRR